MEISYHKKKHGSNYFEGWYIKITMEEEKNAIAFIVGTSQTKKEEHAFIQIIDNIRKKTEVLDYPITSFSVENKPFKVTLPGFRFSETELYFEHPEMVIDITFSNIRNFKSSLYAPTIMGPFSYLPYMQCRHSVCSIYHEIYGRVQIKNFIKEGKIGIGYIEKDRGVSFPKKYIWFQSESQKDKHCCMFAIADVPVYKYAFEGILGFISTPDLQLVIGSYYGAKCTGIKKWKAKQHTIYKIELIQRKIRVHIEIIQANKYPLQSPIEGSMIGKVYESLDSYAWIRVYKDKMLLFEGKDSCCGFEMFDK